MAVGDRHNRVSMAVCYFNYSCIGPWLLDAEMANSREYFRVRNADDFFIACGKGLSGS